MPSLEGQSPESFEELRKPLSYVAVCFILMIVIVSEITNSKARDTPPSKDETVLFRTSEHNLVFSLKIDNDFVYSDSFLNKDVVLGYPIGRYKKKKDSSTINLRINDKDTTFKFPLFKADSILFGLTANRKFYIVTNHYKNAWIID